MAQSSKQGIESPAMKDQGPLKVCVVGGIFGMSPEYRSKHRVSPETVLADGLKRRGIDVTTAALSDFRPEGCFDIVHVHHFGRGAVRMAGASRDRKSTRLNSSHLVISYAVFCLK